MKHDLEQLYVAYRKAKGEAFGDSNCAHGLKFAQYERHLHSNLARLASLLSDKKSEWWQDAAFLGSQSWVAKSGDSPSFRPVIDATVDYMVLAALWVIRVGHLYDRQLSNAATASRITRLPDGSVDDKCAGLFEPYYAACERWRQGALEAASDLINNRQGAVLVTLDLKRFHHNVDAGFLLNSELLDAVSAKPDKEQELFTHQLIKSFLTWNSAHGSTIGLPAGLSASPLIGNVLLKQMDVALETLSGVAYYARYVDNVLLVVDETMGLQTTDDVFSWLESAVHPLFQSYSSADAKQHYDGLRIHLPYAEKSDLIFTKSKARVFHFLTEQSLKSLRELIKPLHARHAQGGPPTKYLDEEIDESLSRLAARTNQGSDESEALAKALMCHRSEVAKLTKLLETRSWDERPSSWRPARQRCYLSLERLMLSVEGFFEYSKFCPRALGVMATTRDWNEASRFVDALAKLRTQLAKQAAKLSIGEEALNRTFESLTAKMHEAVVASITNGTEQALVLCKKLAALGGAADSNDLNQSDLRRQAELLRSADWARLPYWAQWIVAKRDMLWAPSSPAEISERIFPGETVRHFAAKAQLVPPHWAAIAFPTRQMPSRVFDELLARRSLSSMEWTAIRETLTSSSHQTNTEQKQLQGSHVSSYGFEGDEPWLGHILNGLDYLLRPIKNNNFYDLPPVRETQHENEEPEYYVRFAQAELDVEGEDGFMRDFWRFEGFRSDWLKTEAGQQGWASDREFVEYYQSIPLAILELEIVGGETRGFMALQNIANDITQEKDPGGWFKVRARREDGNAKDGAIEGMLFRSLHDVGSRINLDDIAPADPADQDKLDDAIRSGNVDEADGTEITRLLSPVAGSGMDRAVVYDVGQGNCIGLCGASGSVGLYFDFGGGVTQNSFTFPSALTKFCFTQDPPIILSHWDHDHWSSWTRDNRCLSSEWLAPRQQLTSLHVSLIASIQGAGGKLWFLPRNFQAQWFGHIYLEVCNGTNRNNSGIALTISERANGGGHSMLMPGDADYRYIPSFIGGTQYLSVVAPHHGGKLHGTNLPLHPGQNHARLVYSAGQGNSYNHPLRNTRLDHDANGWSDPHCSPAPHFTRLTEDRNASGLGHVLLRWHPRRTVPSIPCGGLQCQLQAQQT